MTRTSTAPCTFQATGGTGLHFSRLVFDDNGYVSSFVAKDPAIGLDTSAGTVVDNVVTVSGLDYFLNTMGRAVPEPGSSPAVTISAASSIGSTSARLNGTVNPNGAATTAQFEYGPTTSYGSSASVTLSPDDGSSAQSVSAAISDLQAGTTYHVRLAATNSHGTTVTNDATFKTSSSGGGGGSTDDNGGGGVGYSALSISTTLSAIISTASRRAGQGSICLSPTSIRRSRAPRPMSRDPLRAWPG